MAIAIKHYGDIKQLHGYELEPVDVIIGGSPCQDFSVAGRDRKGLEGDRSGLFLDFIRVIKEMRESDIRAGRTGSDIRPRWVVFENVPGIFSANKGKDFQKVLTEIIRINEPEAPDVPCPENGKWARAGLLYDGVAAKWSLSYKVHDAQFWGTPQRRRRLCLVADLGGLCAGEVLFEPKSSLGNFETGSGER